tara:strand:+ start:56 stop:397 length:342 start_codon:yes stop_codon:yes gene_type:complete
MFASAYKSRISRPLHQKKQGEENMIEEKEMNENEHALERFSMMLNVIDAGDCVEDFSDPKIIANIHTLTNLLRHYIRDQLDAIAGGTLGQPLMKNEDGEWVAINDEGEWVVIK